MNAPRPFSAQNRQPRGESAHQPIILCFSHLRWDFVHQRPQHLFTQATATHRVYYIEEPEFAGDCPEFRMRIDGSGVTILTPILPAGSDAVEGQRKLVKSLKRSLGRIPQIHWFYTPMALRFARDLPCDLCVYDCMDELSAFRFAPPDIRALEDELLAAADLVFTGGRSLYEAKRARHRDVHCFPSSVDVAHFRRARGRVADPADQAGIGHPRIGFFGVIDERMDLDLVARTASAMPDVHFVMLGPTAKIDPADLPCGTNLHWLGRKGYDELPAYIANWQAAWMPFALNEATRYISPTKTPEFLAAGLRVTSTAVRDVVATYGARELVTIADVDSMEQALRDSLAAPSQRWLAAVDQCLASMSWKITWASMMALMQARTRVADEVA
jgi:glycosyltransferase involved in cell wall biosynthesis